MVLGGYFSLPAGFDHDGLVGLDDQRRAGEFHAGRKVLAQEDGGLPPGAIHVDGADGGGGGIGLRQRIVLFVAPGVRLSQACRSRLSTMRARFS